MKVADIFNALRGDLEPFVHNLKGTLSIARDQFEILELLQDGPSNFRVILGWNGEEPIGEDPRSGIVNHTFQVIVSQNRGLSILLGGARSQPRQEDKPLWELVGQIRDRLRSWTVPVLAPDQSTARHLEYAGTGPIEAEGRQLDAYLLTFRLKARNPINHYR